MSDEVEDPVALLQEINKAVLAYSVNSIFLTALFLRIDPVAKRMQYSLAGQCRPIVHRRATGETLEVYTPGMPIGVVDDIALEAQEMELQSGDRILLYTDGLTELKGDLELFDEQKLGDFIVAHGDDSADQLANALLRHARDLNEEETFSDDLTLLIADIE